MEISDIQKKKVGISDKIEITFCNSETADDIVTIIIDERVAWEIHNYCQSHLSYAAQKKK